jgi:quercetin dioxygenase-like cupin family protein
MRPGQAGPPHAVDTEQVWTALDGGAVFALGGEAVTLAPGDTVIIPAAQPRRVKADPAAGFAAIVVASPGCHAWALDGTGPEPAADAPETERVTPPWTI